MYEDSGVETCCRVQNALDGGPGRFIDGICHRLFFRAAPLCYDVTIESEIGCDGN